MACRPCPNLDGLSFGGTPDLCYETTATMTLDLGQAADLLKLHPQTVLQLARVGDIPAAKPGKRWVFIEDDLLNWLRSQYNCRRDAGQGGQALCSLKEKLKNILGTLHHPKRRARTRLDWD